MSKWNDCCNDWFRTQPPQNPKEGRIQETHYCPTCKTPIDLIFECSYPSESMTARGYEEDEGELVCLLLGVEDKKV